MLNSILTRSMLWSTWWPTMTRTSWRGCWSGGRRTGCMRRWCCGRTRTSRIRWKTLNSQKRETAGKEWVVPRRVRSRERVSWVRLWKRRMGTRMRWWKRTRWRCRSYRDTWSAPGCFTGLVGGYLRYGRQWLDGWMSGAGAGGRSAGGCPGGGKTADGHLPAAQSDGPGFLWFILCHHTSPGGTFLSQVKKYLTFKAYTRPHYLSLGMMDESRIPEEGDIHRSDLEDLQHLDPLRRAFTLAEEAENITTKGGDFTKSP